MPTSQAIATGINTNGTYPSPALDLGAGGASDTFAVQVAVSGTVSAFSFQMQGSEDGVNFVNAGSAVAAAGVTRIAGVGPFRFIQFTLSGFTGTGTLSLSLADLPDF